MQHDVVLAKTPERNFLRNLFRGRCELQELLAAGQASSQVHSKQIKTVIIFSATIDRTFVSDMKYAS